MTRLLFLFILVPAVELALLIEIGSRIGTLATLGLIAATGLLGASLARYQGLGVLKQIRAEAAAGRIPSGAMVDGVMILLAGAVLITPGILTDAFGFLCLVPATRRVIKDWLWQRLKRAVSEGGSVFVTQGFVDVGGSPPTDPSAQQPGPENESGPTLIDPTGRSSD